MPGSLLGPKVRRSDSARSDHSDVSGYSADSRGKKVSFNRAVRVKKYPRRNSTDDPAPDDNKRFWFKVYKNRNTEGSLRNNKALIDGLDQDQSDYSENDSGLGRLDTIDERAALSPDMRHTVDVGVGTTSRHSSQEADQPRVRRNHVKRLVNKFNEEATTLKFPDEADGNPQDPPVDYGESYLDKDAPLIKHRKNPLINGVKVIFGMKPLKRHDDSRVVSKNAVNLRKTREKHQMMNGNVSTDSGRGGGPHRTSIVLADESTREHRGGNSKSSSRRGKENGIVPRETNNNVDDDKRVVTMIHPIILEKWDSGDQLISDVNRYESTVDKNSEGQFYKTVEEQQQVWKQDKRTVYEEPSPMLSERRAKSHSDLRYENNRLNGRHRLDKVLSSEELSREPFYSSTLTVDRGVQCNRNREQRGDRVLTPSKFRVIRSKDGYVSAYSDVPLLDEEESIKTTSNTSTLRNGHSDAIYSQVDKSKKTKKKKTSSVEDEDSTTNPPSRTDSPVSKSSRYLDGKKTLKTSQKSFGFRLKKAFGGKSEEKNTYVHNDDDWYDVDADFDSASAKRANGHHHHHDIAEVRAELDEDFSSAAEEGSQKARAPASVMREMDSKKREISYENVPHQGPGRTRDFAVGGGTWYRDADEDYRREMAQSDVSYPSGSHVGSSATLGRVEKKTNGFKEESIPKSHTLDRRHMQDKKKDHSQTNGGVKILVNGHELDDTDSGKGYKRSSHRRSRRSDEDSNLPSSVQSDPVSVRGGLAAAYKARQKAALRRSNSTTGGSVFGNHLSPSGKGRHHHGSSGGSVVSSSDSDSARRRRTLVMYIPGVSHREHKSSEGLSRTQSMMGQKHKGSRGHRSPSEDDEECDTLTPLKSEVKKSTKGGDSLRRREVRRRHSMPKDTKFGWFKWKIKGKPSREP